jgi:hypothetical protein
MAVVGVFVACVLAAGVYRAVRAPGSGSLRPVVALPTRTPVAAPTPTPDWAEIIATLDDARSAALARADLGLLATFDAQHSPALAADAAVVRTLATHGVWADGFVLDVLTVRPAVVAATWARLDVVDRRPAFAWKTRSGSVVATVAARAPRRWHVQLKRGGVLGWQIEQVEPARRSTGAPVPATTTATLPRASPKLLGR